MKLLVSFSVVIFLQNVCCFLNNQDENSIALSYGSKITEDDDYH